MTLARTTSRRSALLAPLAVVMLLLVAVIPATAPSARAQSTDAATLLQSAATTMTALHSFGFKLTTIRGQTTILDTLELKSVEGAVERPQRFRASATVKVAIVELTIKAVGDGSHIWVTDPTKSEETYIDVTGNDPQTQAAGDSLSSVLNPDRLLLQNIDLIESPTIAGTEDIDGAATTKVTGTLDLAKVAGRAGIGTPVAGSGDVSSFLALGPRPVTIWIDAQNRVVRLEIEGPITTSESSDVVRRLDLFAFDEPANIADPTS